MSNNTYYKDICTKVIRILGRVDYGIAESLTKAKNSLYLLLGDRDIKIGEPAYEFIYDSIIKLDNYELSKIGL